MAYNKVVYDGRTLVDLTADTVDASVLLAGYTAHGKDGSAIVGTFDPLNMFYPVGSYYETSDTSFDPNTAWGGTWSLETEGLVHIGAGSTYSVGDTGGEETHTLTKDEMPAHAHNPANGTAYAFVETDATSTLSRRSAGGSATANYVTSTASFYRHTATNSQGGGGAHNNMQPYIAVNRWHRTA